MYPIAFWSVSLGLLYRGHARKKLNCFSFTNPHVQGKQDWSLNIEHLLTYIKVVTNVKLLFNYLGYEQVKWWSLCNYRLWYNHGADLVEYMFRILPEYAWLRIYIWVCFLLFRVPAASVVMYVLSWVIVSGEIRIRIRIYLLAHRNLLWDILRLLSSRRAALGIYVILTLWRGRGANQPPYVLLHIYELVMLHTAPRETTWDDGIYYLETTKNFPPNCLG